VYREKFQLIAEALERARPNGSSEEWRKWIHEHERQFPMNYRKAGFSGDLRTLSAKELLEVGNGGNPRPVIVPRPGAYKK
jgi:hypothetical protein